MKQIILASLVSWVLIADGVRIDSYYSEGDCVLAGEYNVKKSLADRNKSWRQPMTYACFPNSASIWRGEVLP